MVGGSQVITVTETYAEYFAILSKLSFSIFLVSLIISMVILYRENKNISTRLDVLVNEFNDAGMSSIECENPILTEYDLQIINAWNRSVNEIEQLNELREKYFKNMVHDLKTPIQILAMNIEMLKLKYESNEYAEAIENELSILERSVTNYLMIEKITFFQNICRSEININTYFDNIKMRYAQLNFSVEIFNYHQNNYINTDKAMLNRIIENLVDNAIKYGAKQMMSIVISPTTIELINSVGPDVQLGNIFKEGRKYSIMGNGLGVEIIKTYITLLEWEINAEQTGNDFIVTISMSEAN